MTRTSSACVESLRTGDRGDPIERWCERFAAEVLMPAQDVGAVLRQQGWTPGATVTNLDAAAAIARRFKVSLRAAVIRLVTTGAATWDSTTKSLLLPTRNPRPEVGQVGVERKSGKISSVIVLRRC